MPRVTRLSLDATCATNPCHIVQPNVKRFIKHFGAIQINRLELTAHLQPPAYVAPSAG